MAGTSLVRRGDVEEKRSSIPLRHVSKAVLSAVLVAVSLSVQGCFSEFFKTHSLANWRAQPNYLVSYSFNSPVGSVLNSCAFSSGLKAEEQCSGRGVCTNAYPNNLANPIYFCKCDPGWADPECRTPRKSHLVAFFLSVTLGWLGADAFYLEMYICGWLKLFTLGGFGIWWIIDIVRVGAAPVYAMKFRVSDDLPHYAFVVGAALSTLTIGFLLSLCVVSAHIKAKRAAAESARSKAWLQKVV